MPDSVVAKVGAISLALLANVGQLRANPALTRFPADLTLVVAGVVAGSALWIRFKHGPAHKSILIPVGLMAVFLLGLINSPFDGLREQDSLHTGRVKTIGASTLWDVTSLKALWQNEMKFNCE